MQEKLSKEDAKCKTDRTKIKLHTSTENKLQARYLSNKANPQKKKNKRKEKQNNNLIIFMK